MATNIVIMGLPGDIKFTKLLNKFRSYFKRINIKRFWIRDTPDTELGQPITIELVNMGDAKKARNFLNNLSFISDMNEYPMEVYLENEFNQYEGGYFEDKEYERRPRPAKRNRPRSRSPGYSQEASKLDMEIELLRKQRQVIEEERRLLVEQKKLEMIREYGPSASREFDHFDDYEPPRKKRQPVPVPKRARPGSPTIAKTGKVTSRPKGLPAFFHPCKKLIADMKPYIEKGTAPEEVGILVKLIRAAIRKDLALALDGKAFMPTADILKLYRERHPKEEDEAFVAKILANIRASYLTTETKFEVEDPNLKEIKKEKESEPAKGNENETNDEKATGNDKSVTKDNENDDAKCQGTGAGGVVANKEIATKETANGENETDAAPDVVAVKTEPNTSQELENISAGNLSEEVNTKTKDDTVLDENAVDGSGDGEAKGDDLAEDWNTEETKVQ